MNLEIIGYLESARQLISDPRRWTIYYSAEDKDGEPVDFNSDKAVCWCSLGALRKVVYESSSKPENIAKAEEFTAYGYLLDAVDLAKTGCGSVVGFNDTHTHQEVMELWDSAIKLAKQDLARGEKS